MKKKIYRPGAIGALLDEYERALAELQDMLSRISERQLVAVADPTTTDPNCRSIQTVLAHVVRAGYAYALDIQRLKEPSAGYPEKVYQETAQEFQSDLRSMFAFTAGVLLGFKDHELEEFDEAKKIRSSWGQVYDVEQLLEHAIVHILRHRRQIERFLSALPESPA